MDPSAHLRFQEGGAICLCGWVVQRCHVRLICERSECDKRAQQLGEGTADSDVELRGAYWNRRPARRSSWCRRLLSGRPIARMASMALCSKVSAAVRLLELAKGPADCCRAKDLEVVTVEGGRPAARGRRPGSLAWDAAAVSWRSPMRPV